MHDQVLWFIGTFMLFTHRSIYGSYQNAKSFQRISPSIISEYFPAILGVIAIGTYILQLWTGFAVVGWPGHQAMIEREKSPGPYWLVMALQTAALIVIPILIALNG